MQKSNLIELLKKFSSNELKEFGEYVRSPFFNKNEGTVKLFDYIRKYAPEFSDKKLDKETAYKKLFPGTRYNDGFLRTIMFNLSKLAEDYLTFTRIKSTEFTEQLSLLSDYNKRELNKMFEKKMKEVHGELSKSPVKDYNYYYSQYRIEDENLAYLQRIHYVKDEKFIKSTGIDNILNNLTYFYLIRILKFYVVILNIRSIYKIEFKTLLLEDILSNFKLESYEDIPLIKIFYCMVMMHTHEDNEKYYKVLKSTLDESREFINSEDLLESLINLENYCLRKIRTGRKDFNSELSEVFKMELKYMNYNEKNKIPYKLFRAITVNALAIKDYNWAQEFIEKYKKSLNDEIRENTINHCTALLDFAMGRYEEALKISSKVKYADVYQKYELKSLTAALYFELNLEEQLLALLDTFRHLISGDTLVPEDRKEPYIRFTRYIRKLYKLKNNFDSAEFDELDFNLKKEKNLLNEEWILNKMKELENKNK
jgi:hypothetical protein